MDDYLIMSSLSGPAPVPGPPLDPGLVMVDPEAQAASHPAPGLQPDLPQQPPVSFPGAPPGHEINFANEVGNVFCFCFISSNCSSTFLYIDLEIPLVRY